MAAAKKRKTTGPAKKRPGTQKGRTTASSAKTAKEAGGRKKQDLGGRPVCGRPVAFGGGVDSGSGLVGVDSGSGVRLVWVERVFVAGDFSVYCLVICALDRPVHSVGREGMAGLRAGSFLPAAPYISLPTKREFPASAGTLRSWEPSMQTVRPPLAAEFSAAFWECRLFPWWGISVRGLSFACCSSFF